MAWTAPDSHVWTTGEVVTATNLNTYIRLNLDALSQSLQVISGNGSAPTTPGVKVQIVNITFTAASGGTAITYPVAFSSWSIPVAVDGGTVGTTVVCRSPTTTGFTAFAFNGSTQITSGGFQAFYAAFGV